MLLRLAIASLTFLLLACDKSDPTPVSVSKTAESESKSKPKPTSTSTKTLAEVIRDTLAEYKHKGDATPEPAPGAVGPSDVIAKIGDVALSKAAFFAIYDLKAKKYVDRGREMPPAAALRYRKSILGRLAYHELLRQAAEKRKVRYSKAALATRQKSQQRGIKDWAVHLQRRGETEASLRAMYVAELTEKALLDAAGKLDITEAEVKADYKLTRADWDSTEVHLQAEHILIAEGEPDAEQKANEVHAKVTKPGVDFTKEATEHAGGVLALEGAVGGHFVASQMEKEFATAVQAMEVGEISEPVKTKFGYHIIKLNGRWPAGLLPIEAAAPTITLRLRGRKLHQERRALKTALLAGTEVLYFMDLTTGTIGSTGSKPPEEPPKAETRKAEPQKASP